MWLGGFTCLPQIPMMAAAMASRNSSSLIFQALARDNAVVDRVIGTELFERLVEMGLTFSHSTMNVAFKFGMEKDRPCVSAVASVAVKTPCQWCLEDREMDVSIESRTQLAKSEEQALRWSERDNESSGLNGSSAVVVANPIDFDVVAWLEDDLLLKWPFRPCQDASCTHRPATSYDDGVEIVSEPDAFAILATLKNRDEK